MGALTYFNKMDDSTRVNIIVNCDDLKPKFPEEDMKAITYKELKETEKKGDFNFNHLIRDCNVFVLDTEQEPLYFVLTNIIRKYQPMYVCSVQISKQMEDCLHKNTYVLVEKKYKMYIYKRNMM